MQRRIQDFKLGGVHLKKLCRVEGGVNNFGVFRVKNHDFMPKNYIFSNFRGGHAGCTPPPLDPSLRWLDKLKMWFFFMSLWWVIMVTSIKLLSNIGINKYILSLIHFGRMDVFRKIASWGEVKFEQSISMIVLYNAKRGFVKATPVSVMSI
jgi:hypothetical protein